MAGELMLINPRRRKRAKHRRRSRRTYARRNPRRHRRRTYLRTVARRNPRRRHYRRRRTYARRNPISFRGAGSSAKSFLKNTLLPASVGAGGAFMLDSALTFLPVPAFLQSGLGLVAAKIIGAVGVGMLAGAVAGKSFGNEATSGALTVTIYDLAKEFMNTGTIGGVAPTMMGWVSPALPVGGNPIGGMGVYAGGAEGLGAYVGSDYDEYTMTGDADMYGSGHHDHYDDDY